METEIHVTRLVEVAELLGITQPGKTCKTMKGLLPKDGKSAWV